MAGRNLSRASLKLKKIESQRISRNIKEARSLTKVSLEARVKNIQFSYL
jgi:hypothetical protein